VNGLPWHFEPPGNLPNAYLRAGSTSSLRISTMHLLLFRVSSPSIIINS
jgi:hypothetical protein